MKLNGKITEKSEKLAVNGNKYYPLMINTGTETIKTSTFDEAMANFSVGDHIEFDLTTNEKNGRTFKNVSNVTKYLGTDEVSTEQNTFSNKDRMDLMEDDIKNINLELDRLKTLITGEGDINPTETEGTSDEDVDKASDKADDASDEDSDDVDKSKESE